jgi:hypothetical protein
MIARLGSALFAFCAAMSMLMLMFNCGGEPAQDISDFTITRQDLPVAVPGLAYTHSDGGAVALDGRGGMGPYFDWHVADGALPGGIELRDDGRFTGVVADGAAPGVYLFLVEATDSDLYSNSDREAFAIRVGDPDQDGPLLAKAKAYEETYRERHAPSGLALTLIDASAPPEDRAWEGYEDAAFATGLALAAGSCRYAVTADPADLDAVSAALSAIETLLAITGKPGFLARGFARDADQLLCCDDPDDAGCTEDRLCGGPSFPDTHAGAGEFAEYHWIGDTGVRQYSGAIFGLTVAFDVVDDQGVRDRAAGVVGEVVDSVWDDGLRILDLDGAPTSDGQVSGDAVDGADRANGYGALLALSWLSAARHVTGEARFADRIDDLLARDYLDALDAYFPAYQGYDTDWAVVHVAFLNFFHLLTLETTDRRAEAYGDRFAALLWDAAGEQLPDRRAADERNPLFSILRGTAADNWDPEFTRDGLRQLDLFPGAPRANAAVDRTGDPAIEKNPDRPTWALDALDADLRPPAPFLWEENPYRLIGGADDGREFPGLDYLLPYWMGRYAGRVPSTL